MRISGLITHTYIYLINHLFKLYIRELEDEIATKEKQKMNERTSTTVRTSKKPIFHIQK